MSGCNSCGTSDNKEESVGGCQNNGTCGTSGCNRLNVFDWLSGMDIPMVDRFDIVEVRFKGGRKEFFRNTQRLDLVTGDAVVLEMPGGGYHLGYVSLMGELVRLQMMKKKVADNDEITKVMRIATQRDIEKAQEGQNREMGTLYRAREIILELNLAMKLSDVEYQGDLSKATFFYSAESRVDFRELIKLLAGEFKIRVEMRQISLRQEAGRLGGIGSCGRELCCSTWLSDFKNVATSAARYQNLSLNPAKLSGQCGRLKCCLNYELETYISELKDVPDVDGPIKTGRGEARLQKTDIFRKIMWFSFPDDSNWYPVGTARVTQIIEMNKQGRIPDTLLEDKVSLVEDTKSNQDLEALDAKYSSKSKKKKKKKKKMLPPGASPQAQSAQPKEAPQRNRDQRPNRSQQQGPRPERPAGEQPKVEGAQTDRPKFKKKPNRFNKNRPKPGGNPDASSS